MDRTETYFSMSKMAEEIQALRREEHNKDTGKWKAGDFYVHIKLPVHVVDQYRDAWSDIPEYIHHPIECTWLPRQDDLQEMIGFVTSKGHVQRLSRFFIEENPTVDSMEQLWLAFVMKQKYGKVWNGSEWEAKDG